MIVALLSDLTTVVTFCITLDSENPAGGDHGTCSSGVCSCKDPYVGVDCSIYSYDASIKGGFEQEAT